MVSVRVSSCSKWATPRDRKSGCVGWHGTCHPSVDVTVRMPTTLPTSTAPIKVWHLVRHPDQEVWCLVGKVRHPFVLTVCRDTTHRARPMRERFADLVSVIQRADQMKEDFLAMGWREPELHEQDAGA